MLKWAVGLHGQSILVIQMTEGRMLRHDVNSKLSHGRSLAFAHGTSLRLCRQSDRQEKFFIYLFFIVFLILQFSHATGCNGIFWIQDKVAVAGALSKHGKICRLTATSGPRRRCAEFIQLSLNSPNLSVPPTSIGNSYSVIISKIGRTQVDLSSTK